MHYRLLKATPLDDDPVVLLQAAGRGHIPIDPTKKSVIAAISSSLNKTKVVPDSDHRPSIQSIIQAIKEQDWYEDQIVFEKTISEKESRIGAYAFLLPRYLLSPSTSIS
jgi:DEAD/DEAH box helicase domain-containing protein